MTAERRSGVPRAAWLAVGGAAAALVVGVAEGGTPLAVAVLAAVVGIAAARNGRVTRAAVLMGAVVVLLRGGIPAVVAPAADEAAPRVGTTGEWEGDVSTLHGTAGGVQRAVVQIRSGGDTTDGTGAKSFRVWAQLPRYPVVAPGDRLRFEARLDDAGDPSSGFAAFLERAGVDATVRVHEMTVVPPTSGAAGALESWRRGGGEVLARTLPAPQAGLASGIVLGLRDLVDKDLAADFTTAGLSHVVAISGWNIALVATTVGAMLRRLPRRPRSVLILLSIAAYTIVAGASASVIRAALMAAVVVTARESGRAGAAAAALGVAALLMLVADPAAVSDAGFQLSVAATAGLLAWGSSMTALLRRRLPRRTPGWLTESLGVSLAAQAATLPLILVDFGRLSLVAPLANLLIAPFVGPAMFVGLAALVAGAAVGAGAPSLIGVVAGTVGWALLGVIVAIARLCASIPFASVDLPPPFGAIGGVVAVLALIAFGTPRGRQKIGSLRARITGGTRGGSRRRAPVRGAHGATPSPLPKATGAAPPLTRRMPTMAAAVLVPLAVLALVLLHRPDGWLRVTTLDVGQGDAILIEGDAGARILVDSGPDPDRLLTLLDARFAPWDRRLDLVILTHPHEDHVAGLALLMTRYRIAEIAEPGLRGGGPGYAAFEQELERQGRHSRRLFAGDRLALDHAEALVRWPTRDAVPAVAPDEGRAINNVSIVLDIRYGARRFLLAGDAEEDVDPRLLRAGLVASGPLDVLKVAHHGSRTATTDMFLDALRPSVAIVSSGAGNRYGHPAPATLARLADVGARTYRTDADGSITAATDGTELRVSATGGRPQRPRATRAAAAPTEVPRIAAWSPPVSMPLVSSWASSPPSGSWLTSVPSRRSPRSSASDSRALRSAWTDPSSRPPPSYTTWTSCSIPGIRSASSATAMPAPGG